MKRHAAELHRSGLTDQTIKISGIESLSAAETRKALGIDAGASWSVAYPHTKPLFKRFKPDTPYNKTKDGRPAKYLSPAKSTNHLYIPPNLAPGVLTDVTKQLTIVEGEKKALLLCQEGIPAIAVPGVWAWRTRDAADRSVPIQDLDAITWPGREVIIAYDSDAARKPDVRAAEWALAEELAPRGAKVSVARPPGPTPQEDQQHQLHGKMGVDDLYVVRGKAALDQALAAAMKPQKPRRDAGSFRGDGDLVERTAAKILKCHRFRVLAGELHVYDNGVYRPGGEKLVEREAHDLLKGAWSAERVTAVLRFIELEASSPMGDEPAVPDPTIINLGNGLLDLKTNTLVPHDPDTLSVAQIPVRYDPKATCPVVTKFLKEILPGPGLVDLVLELIGYLLIASTHFERAFMFVGKGKNGKSTLIKLIIALLGRRNASHIALQDLDDKFRLAEIHGKLLNTYTDLDTRSLKSTSIFKAVTSGDPVTAEKKFRDPFSFRPYCKLLYSCNSIPYSEDHTPGYYRRWIMIPFDVEIATPDRGLLDRLTSPRELSGLLNLALDGLRRLMSNQEFTLPASVTARLDDQRRQENPVLRFIEDKCDMKPGAQVEKDELYLAYKDWCELSGVKFVMNDARFAKALLLTGKRIQQHRPHRGKRLWKGITLKQVKR